VQGFQEVYDDYSDQNFMVLNVVMENQLGDLPDADDITGWGEEYNLTFPVLADDGSFKSEYLEPVGESFSTYILDEEGKVAWVEYGESMTTDVRALAQLETMF